MQQKPSTELIANCFGYLLEKENEECKWEGRQKAQGTNLRPPRRQARRGRPWHSAFRRFRLALKTNWLRLTHSHLYMPQRLKRTRAHGASHARHNGCRCKKLSSNWIGTKNWQFDAWKNWATGLSDRAFEINSSLWSYEVVILKELLLFKMNHVSIN